MSTRFPVSVYLQTDGTQFCLRSNLADDTNPVFTVFPELRDACNARREWSLGKRNIAVYFNGTPMNYVTTVSYYPDAGRYLQFNINEGNALHNYVEQRYVPDGSRVEFEAEYVPQATPGGTGIINLVLKK